MSDGNANGPLAAFSVDVEDYFQVEALKEYCPRSRWEACEDRTVANTERLLLLLERHRSRGTFFVLGWTAKRHPELVKRISEAGHEIASHGYHHELVYNQTPDEFRQDVGDARRLLQDLSGQAVLGYRAPSYTVVHRTQWALPILAEQGHSYDSSIFPIKRMRYGMPNAPRWPYRIELGDGRTLAEFPLPTVRLGGINVPATGGAYLRLLPFPLQTWAVARMIRSHRPFVLTIHPWELDPGQPQFPVPPFTRWTHYHNLGVAQTRLEAFLAKTPFRPQAEILSDLKLL